MPCNSEYQRATMAEEESVRVLTYLKQLGVKNVGEFNEYYGRVQTLNRDTAALCTIMKSVPEDQIKSLSLELQLWWRNHQEWDRKREEQERLKARKAELVRSAASKLTQEERRAVGIED